ncbi:MAG: hypothetical protein BMS9Abin02_1300 [Anaerolineae bacterium]|nr:MAG: hypothetical protein BMS9Abin02_1300 [Anaerolineae bacterium]
MPGLVLHLSATIWLLLNVIKPLLGDREAWARPGIWHVVGSYMLVNSAEKPPLQIIAAGLINELNQIKQAYVLELDDYHLIQDKRVHDLLAKILLHSPRTLHLVLASRVDPPIPLVTLRARSQVTEICLLSRGPFNGLLRICMWLQEHELDHKWGHKWGHEPASMIRAEA